MGTFSLFRVGDGRCERLNHEAFKLERELQRLVEHNMEGLLGIRFVKSEHAISNGRIDTLGLDENSSPVIVEYKRGTNDSVLSQALFYLDWLVNHKADFTLLVQQKLGGEQASAIDWARLRLICIAESYSPYDRYAVNQIGREIQLLQYSRLPGDLLLLELLNDAANPFGKGSFIASFEPIESTTPKSDTKTDSSHLITLNTSESHIQEAFNLLEEHILSLGSDIEKRPLWRCS